MQEGDCRSQQPSGSRQHRLRRIKTGDAVAAPDQFGSEEAGAATDVKHRVDRQTFGGPEFMQKGSPTVKAGVYNNFVVDPCQPRVSLNVARHC